ncbi:MAG: CpaE family protein [Thermaurantiacus sp.]
MALDGATGPNTDDAASRPERKLLVAFAADAETEAALKQGLAECGVANADVRRGDILQATAALQKMSTPATLIVDVSGHPQPVAALEDLAGVVEPDVRVLAIGDREDVGFYRQVTRGLGVLEYLFKPISPTAVAQHFGPLVQRRPNLEWAMRGGRVLAVTGARGGAGATTIAVNLAWFLAKETFRHTVLVDADLHCGTAALMLGVQPGPGLRVAIEHPNRVDELFVERSVTQVSDRLHLLAAEENLVEHPNFATGAAEKLINTLRRRYNFIILDVEFNDQQFNRDLLMLAHQRIIVMEPSLPSVRDALRLLQMPGGVVQAHRPIIVLNHLGRKGGLTKEQVAEAMRVTPDVIVPDLPGKIESAALLGEPAITRAPQLRKAILKLTNDIGTGRGEMPKPTRKRWFGLFG